MVCGVSTLGLCWVFHCCDVYVIVVRRAPHWLVLFTQLCWDCRCIVLLLLICVDDCIVLRWRGHFLPLLIVLCCVVVCPSLFGVGYVIVWSCSLLGKRWLYYVVALLPYCWCVVFMVVHVVLSCCELVPLLLRRCMHSVSVVVSVLSWYICWCALLCLWFVLRVACFPVCTDSVIIVCVCCSWRRQLTHRVVAFPLLLCVVV